MDFCASFQQLESHRSKIQELRYPINNLSQALTQKNHRIILEVPSLEGSGFSISKIEKLLEENPQLFLDFYEIKDLNTWCEKSTIKHRYMYHYPVSLWSMTTLLCDLQVSDILLGEPLTFQIKRIAVCIKDNYPDIKIRICPHLGQPRMFKNHTKEINHFWVLPQHLKLYTGIVDVCDILEKNPLREATLITLYTKGEVYDLPLNLLIESMDLDIPGFLIDDDLARKRLDCQQRCMMHQGQCHTCDMRVRTAELLKNREVLEKLKNIKES